MSVCTLISVDEYLRTSFDPDRDFVDGEVVERNVGKRKHEIPIPDEEVFTRPPYLCVELMSPDDTITGMQDRIDDYLRFGVPNIWVVDSWKQRGWNVTSDGWRWRPMASCVPPMAEPPCPDRRAASLSTRLQKFAHVFRSRKGNTLADFPRVDVWGTIRATCFQ